MANYAADLTSFTAAQRKAFQNAAALSPQHSSVLGYTDNPDGTTTNYLGGGETETGRLSPDGQGAYNFNAISSSALAPVPSITPVQPQQTPIYPVAGLGPPPAEPMGAQENKAQALSEKLQQINDSLVGESAYRAEQEQAQGIPTLLKTQKDLEARLNALKNEGLALSTYSPDRDPRLAGQGITTGGLHPFNRLHAEQMRINAVEALGVNSLLEASRGNVSFALSMVDRAVAQRFDPLKEEQRAKIANLDLIMRSPAYTKEEKDRAARQKAVEEAKANELEVARSKAKATQELAVDLISQNPNIDARTLELLRTATDPIQAAQIAAQAGLVLQTPDTQLTEAGGRKLLINSQTGETIKDLGASSSGGGGSTFSSTQKNSGASKAGMAIADFNALSADVQNYYVNSTENELEAINAEFDAVASGNKSKEEVAEAISSALIPQAVKDHLIEKLEAITPAEKEKGFFESSWESIVNFFGGNGPSVTAPK